jgi:RimJ/RimL family protein N-acetyltransferase
MNITINYSVFDEFPVLESDRLLYRKMDRNDANDLYLIESNDEVVKFMDKPKIESVEASKKYIKFCSEEYKNRNAIEWGIIEKGSNKYIGNIGFWKIIKIHCRGEIGYSLTPSYWGKGYMSEALQSILTFGFKILNLHSIEANVNPENINSIKSLERNGFQKEAYFRENYLFENKFIDTVTFSLLEKDL